MSKIWYSLQLVPPNNKDKIIEMWKFHMRNTVMEFQMTLCKTSFIRSHPCPNIVMPNYVCPFIFFQLSIRRQSSRSTAHISHSLYS